MSAQSLQLLQHSLEPVVAAFVRLVLPFMVATCIALGVLAAVMLAVYLIAVWREARPGRSTSSARRIREHEHARVANAPNGRHPDRARRAEPVSGRMKTGALPAVIAVAAAMACAGGEGAPAPDIDDAAIADTVLRLENEMNTAVDALDCDAGLAPIGDREPIFVGNGYALDTRSELVDMCAQMVAARTGAEFDIEDIDAHVLSPDAAYVVRRGDYTIHGTDDTSTTVYLIMTTIWHREPDGWRMVHLHESVRMPPPDSAQQEAR
jgi:ketosteroid isomerase-like protein